MSSRVRYWYSDVVFGQGRAEYSYVTAKFSFVAAVLGMAECSHGSVKSCEGNVCCSEVVALLGTVLVESW